MKILTTEEIRQADAFTISNEPIASIDLMERASKAFCLTFKNHFDIERSVKIFCGTGNNGGDGLAVSRLLKNYNFQVDTYTVNYSGSGSDDFIINYKRLSKKAKIENIASMQDLPEFDHEDIIIDALFGSGLTRPLTGLYGDVIEAINSLPNYKVSIDIASGLLADIPIANGIVFKPDLTISFQTPKMAFLIPENESFVGDWIIADIGLNDAFIQQTKTRNYLITDETVAKKLKKRKKFAHKGDFGKGIIISGSYGKMGASILSARACIRTGTGLLTLHIPQCGYNILQSSVPEAMVSTDKNEFFISSLPDLSDYNAIGVGPGIGTHSETINMIQKLFENNKIPLVLDADALNIISKSPSLIEKIPVNSILTPHIKEFERISGPSKNHFERLQKLTELASRHQVFIVLKGAFTAVSTPEGKTYFNSTGNPGMATGGSGDVLTGIITSLLAQNYTPEEASLIGVYIHGMAGDIAASKFGHEGLISSDIIDCIPQSISILRKK